MVIKVKCVCEIGDNSHEIMNNIEIGRQRDWFGMCINLQGRQVSVNTK